MPESNRAYPFFALCGLKCGLCPRHHADGDSRCPGCGGPDFHKKHPSCAVITCNRKHDDVEFCFQCSAYPCDRYKKPSPVDSFITYRNVLTDMAQAKKDVPRYKRVLNEKIEILKLLLDRYNDGKRKSFYCMAVNLLSIEDLKSVILQVKSKLSAQDPSLKEKATAMSDSLTNRARQHGITLVLRK
jgi:hypothetical protein